MKANLPPTRVLFLSDLDGTWLSRDPAARAALDRGVRELKEDFRGRGIDLQFGYVTARPPVRVAREGLPSPDWTITHNGGSIHRGDPGAFDARGEYRLKPSLAEWQSLNEQIRFTARAALAALGGLLARPAYRGLEASTAGRVVGDPAADECPYALHVALPYESLRLAPEEQQDRNHNGVPDILEPAAFRAPRQVRCLVKDLERELARQGIQAEISPVYPFDGRPLLMFDVASPYANKGKAVEFLARREGIAPDHLIVAGDGGNDLAMMRSPGGGDDGRRAIIVGRDPRLRRAAGSLRNAEVRPPSEDSALGVLRGLHHHLEAITRERGSPVA